jgi:predicted NBD/HSP70 family sugar kinase
MYIGIDIGGSKVLVVAGDARYRILRQAKVETPATAQQGMIEIIHLVEQVAAVERVRAIGVAAPGPVDRAGGRLFETPPRNLSWGPVDIGRQLTNHFKAPVVVEHDAAAAALAEAVMGAAKGKANVLYVTISTGVGMGVVVDGQIYHGFHDTEAATIYVDAGGQEQEFEEVVSGRALKRRFGKYGYQITDPKTWDLYAADLAVGLHDLISALSPEIVVIGGGVGVHLDRFHEFLVRHLQKMQQMYPLPPIVGAKYIETGTAHGALILAARLEPNHSSR